MWLAKSETDKQKLHHCRITYIQRAAIKLKFGGVPFAQAFSLLSQDYLSDAYYPMSRQWQPLMCVTFAMQSLAQRVLQEGITESLILENTRSNVISVPRDLL